MLFALGLLVAAFVISQQVIDYHCSQITAEIEQQDPQEEDDSETEVRILSSTVFLPANTVELEPFDLFFIREIFDEQEEETPKPANEKLEDNPYFKTLFRQIISPNAP